MALFVPLDASYDQDPKVLDLEDEHAELLFVRSLAYSKRHALDGAIHRRALRSFAPFQDDIDPDDLASMLVNAGLWTATEKGWRITAWLKRNPSTEEFLTPTKGRELAHQRHHVKTGRPKDGCPFCFPLPTEDPQVAAHDAMRGCGADADHALPEPETEPQPEPFSDDSQNHSDSEPAPAAGAVAVDEQMVNRALLAYSRIVTDRTPGVLSYDAFAAGVRRDAIAEGIPDDLRVLLIAGHDVDAAAAERAGRTEAAVDGPRNVPAAESTHPLLRPVPTFCGGCEDGWVFTDGNDVARCPKCNPNPIGAAS